MPDEAFQFIRVWAEKGSQTPVVWMADTLDEEWAGAAIAEIFSQLLDRPNIDPSKLQQATMGALAAAANRAAQAAAQGVPPNAEA